MKFNILLDRRFSRDDVLKIFSGCEKFQTDFSFILISKLFNVYLDYDFSKNFEVIRNFLILSKTNISYNKILHSLIFFCKN